MFYNSFHKFVFLVSGWVGIVLSIFKYEDYPQFRTYSYVIAFSPFIFISFITLIADYSKMIKKLFYGGRNGFRR